MMNIDLNKLRYAPEELSDVVSILKKIKSELVRVHASDHTLTIYACHLKDKWGGDIKNPCYTMVRIPYLGKDFNPIFTDLDNILGNNLEESAVPAWGKEHPISYKKHKKVSFDPSHLSRSLEYLLRVGHCEKNSLYDGVAFRHEEVSCTNGNNLHVCNNLPVLSSVHALFNVDAAKSLLQSLRKLETTEVKGLYKVGKQYPSRGTFVFSLEDSRGMEVQIGSFPTEDVYDENYHRARLPIDENRVSVSMHQPFLEEICRYTVNGTSRHPAGSLRASRKIDIGVGTKLKAR